MVAIATKADLTPAVARLVELMQGINFGSIEMLVVRDGEPVLNPRPRVIHEWKIGGDNGRRLEASLSDFVLKKDVVELLGQITNLGNATIRSIEIKHGLPFKMTIEEGGA